MTQHPTPVRPAATSPASSTVRSRRRSLRRLVRHARRAALAAAVSGSLAVLLSPQVGCKAGSLAKSKPVPSRAPQPPLTLPREGAPSKPDERRLVDDGTRRKLFAAVSRCRRSLPEKVRWRMVDAIQAEAEQHGYDPMFVMAIVEVESTCSPTANGPRGAVGLVQIKPSTARAVAKELGVPWRGRTTLLEPETNVKLGIRYLRKLQEQFGDPYVAIAAYNRGPARASGMSQHRAKQDRYVKKVLTRYETLLEDHA